MLEALSDAETVVNIGAGAGSYEPRDRDVTAVEPSEAMRNQRPPDLVTAVDGVAEALPFPDAWFDAAMATITIHQWRDLDRGLQEMRRVSRGPVVILTFDAEALKRLWIADYMPELIAAEAARYPAVSHVCDVLGGTSEVTEIPIPLDCVDGFGEAFYGRPERMLDVGVRQAQSGWAFIEPDVAARSVERLRQALESGEWDERYGTLRTQPEYLGSLRLVVAHP
ncbi:MAG TPA: class I SAM-dependent methyltransferase [Mycobacteriales bacterium]|nr:class I SAM-dependent methyltransferase [Mycobacteriales bacterium]